ncbi:hypothetical protein NL676_024424 [Syzygium grande]|nr:hypothetical protein NL676_024424 [Syzygium grande]
MVRVSEGETGTETVCCSAAAEEEEEEEEAEAASSSTCASATGLLHRPPEAARAREAAGLTMSLKTSDAASPLDPIPIDASLTLVPRVRLTLAVHPASPSSLAKPLDDWQLKKALLDFLKGSLAAPLSVPDGDLEIRRVKDVRKWRRDDPVVRGSLVIRDLGFLRSSRGSHAEDGGREDEVRVLEEKYADWKRYLVEKMNGMDLVLGGVKFVLGVEAPASDSFEGTRKEWEEFYAFGNQGGYNAYFSFGVCMCLCVFWIGK